MILLRYLLGDVLRRHRQQQARTLREVAAGARISLGYLSEVERGQKEASSELLTAICAALGIRLSDVLSDVAEQLAGFEPAPAAPAAPETAGDGAVLPTAPDTTLPPTREPVGAGAGAGTSGGARPVALTFDAADASARSAHAPLEPRGLHRGVFGDMLPTAVV